jgi:hypothetical protein
MASRGRQLVALALLGTSLARAQAPPAPFDPARFRARDSHQGFTIAVAPVLDEPAAVAAFGKDVVPPKAGILAVEFLLMNDRAGAVRVALERIVVETEGQRFEPIAPARVALALYPLPEPKATGRPGRREVPKLAKDKNRPQRELAEAELGRAHLRAEVIPAGGRARGFRYFDLRGTALDPAGLRVYVPEVTDTATGEGLLFFEIELQPYAEP